LSDQPGRHGFGGYRAGAPREHGRRTEPPGNHRVPGQFGGPGGLGGAGGLGGTGRRARDAHTGWRWLLVIPITAPLLVPLYNRVDPKLWGIPFFYWYQTGCALLAALVITIVIRLTRGED
jgi:hypothetical protein